MTALRVAVKSFGAPDVLQIEEFDPETQLTPRPNQVVVKIEAFGINPVETYVRSGLYDPLPSLPYTPGNDAGGVVHALGEPSSELHLGQRVWLTGSVSGAYAQYCVCNREDVHPLPDSVTFEEAAALGIPYRTAYRALSLVAQAKRGESVLVHGATGGVGIAALQFAKILGLGPIMATTSSNDEAVVAMLKLNGADEVGRHGEFTQAFKVDVIIENLANVNLAKDLKALKKNGRVVLVGNRGEVTINPRDLMRCEGSIRGMVGPGSVEDRAVIDSAIQEGLEAGLLKPVVGHVFPLKEIAAAHDEVMSHSRGTRGKIVVRPFL